MTDIFRALADKSRRALLDKLFAHNGQTLTQLCEGIPISRQAVSKHLAILQRANLIAVRRHGRETRHYLNPVPLAQIMRRWVSKFEDVPILALADCPPARRKPGGRAAGVSQ